MRLIRMDDARAMREVILGTIIFTYFFSPEMEPRHDNSFIRTIDGRADGFALRDDSDPDPPGHLGRLRS